MVGVVFFAYRFAMIVYVGASLTKVVGAMREEEDWKSAAKTPVIILICLAVADLMSTMILGV